MKRVVLGPEYDQTLRDALQDTLREMNGEISDKTWGIAGSQEVETWGVKIDGKTVEVRSETYIGLAIEGDEELVDQIVCRLRKRTNS